MELFRPPPWIAAMLLALLPLAGASAEEAPSSDQGAATVVQQLPGVLCAPGATPSSPTPNTCPPGYVPITVSPENEPENSLGGFPEIQDLSTIPDKHGEARDWGTPMPDSSWRGEDRDSPIRAGPSLEWR